MTTMPGLPAPTRAASRPDGAPRAEGILVLNKVEAVLRAFADGPERARPSDVAARIGANKSTTYRLLTSMQRTGLLDRFPDGSFGLGLWLMELGSVVEGRIDLRAVAAPELSQLRDRTGLTAFLTVRHGWQATCIDRLPGSNVDVLALRLGGVLPLSCGAGPRVLLASLSPPELDAYFSLAPFAALTPHSLVTASELRADVGRTRRQGYVLSMEDVTIGVGALGAPVRDASGAVVAAVSVAGLRQEFEGPAEARVAGLVGATAAGISAALGRRRRPESAGSNAAGPEGPDPAGFRAPWPDAG